MTPARPREQLEAYAAAFKACGGIKTHAAIAMGMAGPSGSKLYGAAVQAGLLEATPRWAMQQALGDKATPGMEVARLNTIRDAEGNITSTSTQERPDKGECVSDKPPNFAIKYVTEHEVGGELNQKWTRYEQGAKDAALAMEVAAAALAADLPRAAPVKAPKVTNALLCNVYTITDFHMGMLAWHREGGADWDIPIATATLRGAFAQMVAGAPAAETCVIAQLGDFLHYDGMVAATPTSGHPLDADGRFSKMVGASLYVLRDLVAHALTRHRKVVLLMAEGNHDIASSVWLRHMFKALYENEPRVEVIDSELPYYAYKFGKVMLGWHHSHLAKMGSLSGIFSSQFREMWGQCPRVYLHTGHLHHRHLKEDAGAIVEQHPTLAARDAYSARGGYQAERAAIGITYHAEFGEVGRNTVRPEMLLAA